MTYIKLSSTLKGTEQSDFFIGGLKGAKITFSSSTPPSVSVQNSIDALINVNVAYPTLDDHAATKKFVDDSIGGLTNFWEGTTTPGALRPVTKTNTIMIGNTATITIDGQNSVIKDTNDNAVIKIVDVTAGANSYVRFSAGTGLSTISSYSNHTLNLTTATGSGNVSFHGVLGVSNNTNVPSFTSIGSGSYIRFGSTSTATSHTLTANDVMLAGKLEVDGLAYFDDVVQFGYGTYALKINGSSSQILDKNDNIVLKLNPVSSAVKYFKIYSAAVGDDVTVAPSSGDLAITADTVKINSAEVTDDTSSVIIGTSKDYIKLGGAVASPTLVGSAASQDIFVANKLETANSAYFYSDITVFTTSDTTHLKITDNDILIKTALTAESNVVTFSTIDSVVPNRSLVIRNGYSSSGTFSETCPGIRTNNNSTGLFLVGGTDFDAPTAPVYINRLLIDYDTTTADSTYINPLTGYIVVGSDSDKTNSHTLTTGDTLFKSAKIEFDGVTYHDSQYNYFGGLRVDGTNKKIAVDVSGSYKETVTLTAYAGTNVSIDLQALTGSIGIFPNSSAADITTNICSKGTGSIIFGSYAAGPSITPKVSINESTKSTLYSYGSFGAAIEPVTVSGNDDITDITLDATDYHIYCYRTAGTPYSTEDTAAKGTINVTLPAASACVGRVYSIKYLFVTDNPRRFTLNILPNGTDTIDFYYDATSPTLTLKSILSDSDNTKGYNESCLLISDGVSNWHIIAESENIVWNAPS